MNAAREKQMRKMRLVLATCAMLAWGLGPAGAERFDVARDNSINSALIMWNSNMGAATQLRIKGSDHQYLADWDTEPIAAWVAANPSPTGYQAKLWVMPVVGTGWPDPAIPVHVSCVWSENDWYEADGDCFANYNWTDPLNSYAVTYMNARDTVITPAAIPWTFPGSNVGDNPPYPPFVNCTFLDTFLAHGDKRLGGDWQPWLNEVKTPTNSRDFMIGLSDEGSRVGVDLDWVIVEDMLNNEDNRGLVLWNMEDWGNKCIYSDDESADCWPYIEIGPIPAEVSLDIKPGSWPNPLNTVSRGVLPLAICGSDEFDVMTIDPETILVGDVLGPIRWSYEDVATPFEAEPCEGHDLNGDGFMDLTLKFSTQEMVSVLGLDLLAGQTVPLLLSGALTDGTPLTGSDCVWVLTPGDGNMDGQVDGLDYVAWSNHYMTGATWSEGDYNDDGVVDGLDYVAWSSNYGAGYDLGAPVPEPATLALLAIGALGLIRRRRK